MIYFVNVVRPRTPPLTGVVYDEALPHGAAPDRVRFVRVLLDRTPTEDERDEVRRQARAAWPGRPCLVEFAVKPRRT